MRKNGNFDETRLNTRPIYDFAHLVPAAQNGGKQSLTTICEAFTPLVLSLARRERYYHWQEEVKSIAYEAIINCVLHYSNQSYTQFPGYIKKAIVFALQNYSRKQEHLASVEGTELADAPLSAVTVDSAEDALLAKLVLTANLRKLPAHYHRLLGYLYWGKLTQTEAAKEMGISQQAVAAMKKRALALLKELMSNHEL
ncbi:MAG: sigma-70 family RNA polymerase sigma factor [Acidaminococcaceae bacterium]